MCAQREFVRRMTSAVRDQKREVVTDKAEALERAAADNLASEVLGEMHVQQCLRLLPSFVGEALTLLAEGRTKREVARRLRVPVGEVVEAVKIAAGSQMFIAALRGLV